MFRMGWRAYYPHQNVFINVVFNSKSSQNYSRFSNSQFDQLVASAAREPDQAKQLQLYNQAQQILVDEAPALFVYYYGRFRLVKPYVKDLIFTPQDPLAGDYLLRLTSIAQH
jgi:ABC-type transport system substrate-binding protein